MPLFKSRDDAERDGDALYAPSSKDAIKGFLAAHEGYVSTDRIIDYMAEMYGTSEGVTRTHLSRMTRAGELDHPAVQTLKGEPGKYGRSYAVMDEYTGKDWV